MSVILNGKEYKVKRKKGLLTLKLKSKWIKNISEIKGLVNLVNLQKLHLAFNPIVTLNGLDNLGNLKTLNLYNCKIHEIESFKNKKYLKLFYLGKNPLYRHLKFVVSKKKKFSRMTEEERKIAGVNPNVWEVAINCPCRILKEPEDPLWLTILGF